MYICIEMLIRKFISLCLSLFLLTVLLFPTIKVIDFYQNQAEIASLHCVNKAKPALHCEGHCYLKTQLHMSENTASAEKNNLEPYIYLPSAFNEIQDVQIQSFVDKNELKHSHFLAHFKTCDYVDLVFIPPRYLS